jgi:hypothetical protein
MDINPTFPQITSVPQDLSQQVKVLPPDILTEPVLSSGIGSSLPYELKQLGTDGFETPPLLDNGQTQVETLQETELAYTDSLTSLKEGDLLVGSQDLLFTTANTPEIIYWQGGSGFWDDISNWSAGRYNKKSR